ncbi:MAG: hypothetical protein H7Z16_14375 [Pyrinomonadaceae bacterium]|nr:hypothetical protein [Pyrinomonadaceae bacterium]
MFYRKIIAFAAVSVLALGATMTASAATFSTRPSVSIEVDTTDKASRNHRSVRVLQPVNLAILIQDDLTTQVSNELGATRDFIKSLPRGSQVMVGYITSGTLQVRQPFTNDLDQAARSLRIVRSSTSASAFNPYVEVIEALRGFNNLKGRRAVLLISDGLDVSRGFDSASPRTLDLDRAIKHANDRDVAVYTFYAPSVGLTGKSRLAASYGQSSLNLLAEETGGKAFFQGISGFVTFDSYFENLKQTLNGQYDRAG